VPRLIKTALERARVDNPDRISSGVDIVGDIAIVRLSGFSSKEKRGVARELIEETKNVKVVMEQEGGIEGEFRLRKLKHLGGERRTLTVHKENGCTFKVDVAKCYFSPRLSTERLRVSHLVRPKEKVLNMFAGVGPYSIPIAKLAGARVTSCEMNEYAAELHEENDRLNKVEKLVSVVNEDAMNLPSLVALRFDRVLMPLPAEADRFLPTALLLAKKGAMIHYYRHVLGRDVGEAENALREELRDLLPEGTKYAVRKVREVGPRWLEMTAEIRAPG